MPGKEELPILRLGAPVYCPRPRRLLTGSPRYLRLLLSSPFTFLLLLSGLHAAAASPPPPSLHVGDSGGAVSACQSEDEDVLLWSEEARLTMDTE